MKTYGHSSRSKDRTREMCDPKLRWMPEHSIHTKTPRFKLAQSGSVVDFNKCFKCRFLNEKERRNENLLGASQSAQLAFPMTVDLSDWMDAASTRLFIRDFDLLLSFPCRELSIWCSMDVTHSSRSSTLAASKCQILLSNETIWNS